MAQATDRKVRIGQTDDMGSRLRVDRDFMSSCSFGPGCRSMEAILTSIAVVAIAEIGDKTQLLAIVLAARFRKPIPIILGILAATLVNHALAGLVGGWLASTVGPN